MRGALVAALVWAAACTPEIGANTYYCGPDRLCPPDLACDDNSFTCELPVIVERFTCPGGSELVEPNDDLTTAQDLGVLECGLPLLLADGEFNGCTRAAGDADLFAFVSDTLCAGDDPHVEVRLRFPVALVPLTLELLDADGQVIAEGQDCTPVPDFTGTISLCIEFAPEQTTYYLRVQDDPGGPDCDGDCRNNQYALDVLYPLA